MMIPTDVRQPCSRSSCHSKPHRAWDDFVVITPPDGLPTYRLLTGPDDDAFCHRVSEALSLGYELHDGPAVTFNGESVIVAQALRWPSQA
jgi:hypothetical protein